MADPTGRRLRTILLAAAAAVVLIAVAVAAVTDVRAHTRNGSENELLRATAARLTATRHDLAMVKESTASAIAHDNALQASIATTQTQLSATNQALQSTTAHASGQGGRIDALHACLGGVQSALGRISANDSAAAAKDIAAVSGPCTLLTGGGATGLVYPFDFPDPDVILVDNTYYAYSTNSVAGNVGIIESNDLIHWTSVGSALPSLPAWAVPHHTWAPAVAYVGGQYRLYYAADVAGKAKECISVASATQPQGPYLDTSTAPLECQLPLGGSIDPSVFVDRGGAVELLWKSGGPGSATIWAEALDPGGTKLAAGATPTKLLEPDQPWEGGTVEAPNMVWTDNHYLLLFSGNNWNSVNYAVGSATCDGPLGPCHAGTGPILAKGKGLAGPGGQSVFADTSGAWWMAFHAWVPGAVGFPNSRGLYLRRLDLSGAVPVVGAAP